MTQSSVKLIVDQLAPSFSLDPFLVLAMCQQESAYDEHVVRFEPGFLKTYVLPMNLAWSTSVLFSTSWGLMQMMGLSLFEIGYFVDTTPSGIVAGINAYGARQQISTGCHHFTRKLKAADGDVWKALCYWNGDVTGKRGYADSVLKHKKDLEA